MEKNSLLLLSEVIFQINSCQTMQELERNLFNYVNLFVPFRFASYIEVQADPRTGEMDYTIRFCKPQSFAQVEKSWLATLDQATTLWLSSSPEPVVIRDSELFNGDHRADVPSYQLPGYQRLRIFDALQLNVVDGGKTVGRLSLYRAQEDGLFTDQDCFKLRLLSKHISLAFARCARRHMGEAAAMDLPSLIDQYGLTRREGEILGCIAKGMDNADISQALRISKNTLYKHNNSIFQKCGVRDRVWLVKLLM